MFTGVAKLPAESLSARLAKCGLLGVPGAHVLVQWEGQGELKGSEETKPSGHEIGFFCSGCFGPLPAGSSTSFWPSLKKYLNVPISPGRNRNNMK